MLGVYEIKNTFTEEIYIGSSKNIPQRWKAHVRLLNKKQHKNDLLQESWVKYGPDAFEFSILVQVATIEEARTEEQTLLILLSSGTIPTYNLCFDGKGALLTDRTRAKISAALKGRTFTEEHKSKIRKTLFGRYYSPETRAKISKASSAKKISLAHKKAISEKLLGTFRPTKNSDLTIRKFKHRLTGEIVELPTYEMRVKYSLNRQVFSRLIKGKNKRCGDWILLKETK